YLHLCKYQDVPMSICVVEAEAKHLEMGGGKGKSLTMADMDRFLRERQMDAPVAHDLGAQQSAAALFRATEVFLDPKTPRPFKVRTNIVALLKDPITQIARDLNVPTEPRNMTPEQQ